MTELERLDDIIKKINACIAANQETGEDDEAGTDAELSAYVDGMQAALDIVEHAANKLR